MEILRWDPDLGTFLFWSVLSVPSACYCKFAKILRTRKLEKLRKWSESSLESVLITYIIVLVL